MSNEDEDNLARRVPHYLRDAIIVPDTEPQDTDEAELGGKLADAPLSPEVVAALAALGIVRLFPVQKLVVPAILFTSGTACLRQHRDVCVSAPTGSGKTLAYVIPVVETLHKRKVTRLRALVIVPTGELLRQVAKVFRDVCKRTSLVVGTALGQVPFLREGSSLVHQHTGQSKVDILIATPGRLMDHMRSTPSFTLQHLRYLIVDEMDRLLGQSYQSWLPEVLRAVEEPSSRAATGQWPCSTRREGRGYNVRPTLTEPLQKLLFSATLSKDPQQINSLRLVRPRFFVSSASGHYTVPSTLEERMCVVRLEEKLLVLLGLVRAHGVSPCLCFTASVESAHRLALLLNLFARFQPKFKRDGSTKARGLRVAEYTRGMSRRARQGIVEAISHGGLDIIVCSDLLARGIDIDEIKTVINYDVPVFARTYVHRVGRTARAGTTGTAYTLLRKEEVRHFKQLTREVEGSSPRQVRVKEETWQPLRRAYQAAAEALGDALERHARQQDPYAGVQPILVEDTEGSASSDGDGEEEEEAEAEKSKKKSKSEKKKKSKKKSKSESKKKSKKKSKSEKKKEHMRDGSVGDVGEKKMETMKKKTKRKREDDDDDESEALPGTKKKKKKKRN